MKLEQRIKILKKFRRDLNKTYARIIKTNEDSWVLLLSDDQMYNKGIDGNNKPLGNYTPYSLSIKQENGQRTDHITLRDTKEFHDSIALKLSGNKIETIAPGAQKEDTNLLDEFGEDIIKLTPKNKQKIIDNIYIPAFRQIMKNTIL